MKDNFVGSNAAYTKTQWLHYLKHDLYFIFWTLGIIALSCLLLLLHWMCFAPVFLLELWLVWTVLKGLRDRNARGTTNAAVITSLNPLTIAALAELTLVEGKSYPGIQIAPVKDSFDGQARIGMRVPVVCNYALGPQGFDAQHWGAVLPTPISEITADPNAIEHAARLIPPQDWVLLEKEIKRIPDLTTENMHLVQAPQKPQ